MKQLGVTSAYHGREAACRHAVFCFLPIIFQIHFSWKIAFRQICNKLLILLAVPTAPMRRTLKIRTPGKSTEPQKKTALERTPSLSGVRGSASVKRTSHSLMRLAAIQIVERKYNLPGLTPKSGFIATEAVEGIIGQIAEPQETTCELNIRSNLALGRRQS